jgi:hypothetical protein
MKLKNNRLALLTGLLLASPLAINQGFAQDEGAMPPPPPPGPEAGMEPGPGPKGPREGGPRAEGEGPRRQRPGGPEGMGRGAGGGGERMLSPEEREKLQAARLKVGEDADVKAKQDAAQKANKELAELMNAKLLEVDPSLGPILEKLKNARERMANRRPGGEGGPGARPRPEGDGPPKGPKDPGADAGKPEREGGLGKLSKEERDKLQAAREQAKSDPAVTQAREKVQAAGTPEEKTEARKALQTALRDAMTKANPETAAILDKMSADRKKEDAVN